MANGSGCMNSLCGEIGPEARVSMGHPDVACTLGSWICDDIMSSSGVVGDDPREEK